MKVSLQQLLRTGCFGALQIGMSMEQVRAFLGKPIQSGVHLQSIQALPFDEDGQSYSVYAGQP